MNDQVNPTTGRAVSLERTAFVLKRGAQLRDYEPTNPVEMEYFIREAVGSLEELPDALYEINVRRYAAERAYSAKKNTRMAHYGSNGMQVAFARAQAEVDAQPELEAWHNAKAEYHYADDTGIALRTKVNSMLNINKAITAHYGAHR